MSSVAENVALCRSQLPPHVELVAVSKTKTLESIREAYSAGERHFGENYVQEIIEKVSSLPNDIQWHFIGHLQTNKINTLLNSVPNLWMIETIDSVRIADAIQSACIRLDRKEPIRILVEVATSEESSKTGVPPYKAEELVNHILTQCNKLQFCGLMTVANPSKPTDSFTTLADLRQRLVGSLRGDSFVLSMGMSSDWEEAVRLGSTEVRIGSAIFGTRS
jgi:PLP dependent protein